MVHCCKSMHNEIETEIVFLKYFRLLCFYLNICHLIHCIKVSLNSSFQNRIIVRVVSI